MNKKIFISPERRSKPHGPYAIGGVYEHDICNEIGSLLKRELEYNDFYVTLKTEDEGSNTMANRVNEANKGKYDYYMCLHSNGADGTATGAECLYYNHPASKKANQLVYDKLVKLYPSKRGMKDFSHFYENRQTQMVVCYPEIGFHDNLRDAEFILNNKPAIAKALCSGICAYFDVEYTKQTTELPTTEKLYKVQLGAFKDKENALKLKDGLYKLGYEPYIVED